MSMPRSGMGKHTKKTAYLQPEGAIKQHIASVCNDLNMFLDKEFYQSGRVLDGVLKARKREGKESTNKPLRTMIGQVWRPTFLV